MNGNKNVGVILVLMAVLLLTSETSPVLASRAQWGLPMTFLDDGIALEIANSGTCAAEGQRCEKTPCCDGCTCLALERIYPPRYKCYGSCSTSGCPGKSSWPELVGTDGKEAKKVIEKENPNVNAIVLLVGTPVTKDFRCDRVWVFVNENGVVVKVPIIT